MSKRTHDHASGTNPTAKRAKASQACEKCRKNKTRCELLDGISAASGCLTCHRCKVLNVQCSFEASNIIHLPPSQSQPTPSILVNSAQSSASSSCSFISPHQLPSPTPSASDPSPNHQHRDVDPSSVKQTRELLQPEDLVPSSSGGSCKDFDWTAAPILAIQELAGKNNPYPSLNEPHLRSPYKKDRDLSSVLSPEQKSRLLEIFELRYAPWMCLPPRKPNQASSPLLDLICCTVAARHLDAITRVSVSLRLQKLTEDLFLNQLPETDPSPESIEALLILSLWAPLTNAGYSVKRDGRTLASSAVNCAMSLGLPKASSSREQALKMNQAQPPPDLVDLTDQTRLWLLVSTTENMMCTGTGRTPASRTTDTDLQFIDPTCVKDNASARELRLGFISKMVTLVEGGCKIRLRSPSNFESFYIETQQVLTAINCLNTFIKPMPMVSQYERFYFDMCLLQFHGWNLVLSHHFLRELRTVMDGYNSQPWMCVRYNGISIPIIYGEEAIESAQNVLSIFLTQSDVALLAAAPDRVFCLITFAATWIIISNFSMYQFNGVNLGWANDKLVSLVAEKLAHIAHSPEHLPAQCAHMIMRLVHAWETRHVSRPPAGVPREDNTWGNKEAEEVARTMAQMSAERTTAGSETYPQSAQSTLERRDEQNPSNQQPQPQPQTSAVDDFSVLSALGFGQEWTTSDMLMDANFWTTFMESLNQGGPGFDLGAQA